LDHQRQTLPSLVQCRPDHCVSEAHSLPTLISSCTATSNSSRAARARVKLTLSAHLSYISDTGAYSLKPLFIAGSTITVVLLDASLIAERWLRHRGKLARNTSWAEKSFSIIAIIAGIAGALGLILLSIFDTYRHPTLHDHFLILFIVGYVVSAIFVCAEYQRLGIHFRQHRILRASFWLKLFFIIVEVALAIGQFSFGPAIGSFG